MHDETGLYFLLDYLPGGELRTLAKKHLAFRPEVLKFYAAEMLLALEHLHRMGIVYRDLKLENIILTESGHIKLIDFGLSKQIGKRGRTYTQCGTCAYLAPEVINKIGYSFTVDIWAFGILICEMVGGFTPF